MVLRLEIRLTVDVVTTVRVTHVQKLIVELAGWDRIATTFDALLLQLFWSVVLVTPD